MGVSCCESTVEDGHLYSVWCGVGRLPLVVLVLFPFPANTPSRQHAFGTSTTALPTKTASVPLLVAVRALVDANTACLRANTSTSHVQRACLRLQYAASVGVRLEYLHPCIVDQFSVLSIQHVQLPMACRRRCAWVFSE